MADARSVENSVAARLAKAPNLPAVAAARDRLAKAEVELMRTEVEKTEAVNAYGAAIGDAIRFGADTQQWRRRHRGAEPADAILEEAFRKLPLHLTGAFTSDSFFDATCDQTAAWEAWQPSAQPVALTGQDQPGFLLRWGGWHKELQSPLPFSALPMIGGGRPWVIVSDEASSDRAHELLQALTLRLACTLPQQSRFTFLDPLRYGQTFPFQRSLPNVREVGSDLAQCLQRIDADVHRIIKDVVALQPNFESLPSEIQSAERFEFIVAADFPKAKAYDRRVSEMLLSIGRAGPTAGRYLILHVVEGAELPHGLTLDDLGPVHRITLKGSALQAADRPPSPALQERLLERLRKAVPARRSAELPDILPPRDRWWTGSAARRIETTLDGRKDGLGLVFGNLDNGDGPVHGVIAAQTGAGKSNLLHALLLGLATRYSPDELQLYLLDLKQGVELEQHAALPHAVVVASNASPALARAVLSELHSEMDRRYTVVFKQGINVEDLETYRREGSPNGPVPRILLVIDEYRDLFQDGDAAEVSADLLALASKGRAAGIHMLLASQTFQVAGMLNSVQIFNDIGIRIAMQMPAPAVNALSEFDREGREMIRELKGVGTLVMNSAGGRDGANRRGQVVKVTKEARAEVLQSIAALAASWPAEKRALWPNTQVFNGQRAPSILEHPLAHIDAARTLDRGSLAQWAARPRSAGGLARTDWRPADRPVPLVLGREYSVHGHATCLLRRLPNQNLMVVASSAPARLGMLGAMLTSCAAFDTDVVGSVRVLDCSGDSEISQLLQRFGARVSAVDPADAVDAISAASDDNGDVLIVLEPDRAPSLRRPTDSRDPLARAPGPDALDRRLREGPLTGRHTVMLFTGAPAMTSVLGRRATAAFAWRAVTQMSQEDSQDILSNRMASQLQRPGNSPIEPALLADIEGHRFVRFMPWKV